RRLVLGCGRASRSDRSNLFGPVPDLKTNRPTVLGLLLNDADFHADELDRSSRSQTISRVLSRCDAYTDHFVDGLAELPEPRRDLRFPLRHTVLRALLISVRLELHLGFDRKEHQVRKRASCIHLEGLWACHVSHSRNLCKFASCAPKVSSTGPYALGLKCKFALDHPNGLT